MGLYEVWGVTHTTADFVQYKLHEGELLNPQVVTRLHGLNAFSIVSDCYGSNGNFGLFP
jgi:hypothetical protein